MTGVSTVQNIYAGRQSRPASPRSSICSGGTSMDTRSAKFSRPPVAVAELLLILSYGVWRLT